MMPHDFARFQLDVKLAGSGAHFQPLSDGPGNEGLGGN